MPVLVFEIIKTKPHSKSYKNNQAAKELSNEIM